jgi:hypothetical protein
MRCSLGSYRCKRYSSGLLKRWTSSTDVGLQSKIIRSYVDNHILEVVLGLQKPLPESRGGLKLVWDYARWFISTSVTESRFSTITILKVLQKEAKCVISGTLRSAKALGPCHSFDIYS